ncbi:hypothetical protein HY522_01090 [bacterium]|nr:hypothetical protein [bacterium]
MGRKAMLAGAAICMAALSLPLSARAAEVDVSAASPASIVWTVPAKARAGEPFTVKIEVRDRFGNVVMDFDRRGTPFELRAVGRGDVRPKSISPESFREGMAEIQAVYQVAERIELAVRPGGAAAVSRGGSWSGVEFRSPPFSVGPGKLAELRVVTPAAARAGTPFRASITAVDAFGNILKDFKERSTGIVLSTGGYGLLNPMRVAPAAFSGGVADVSITYTGTGDIEIIAKDPADGVTGRSAGKISVGPGEPVKFQVTAPGQALVDEAFDVALTVLDAYGNVVTDFNAVGTMVVIGSDGSGAITNAQVPPDKFVKGVAFAKILYDKPENISLLVSEPGTGRTGASAPVAVQPGKVARLELEAPPAIEAGNPFSVKIRTVDSRGNLSKSAGQRVILEVRGSVATTPIDIPAAGFKNGEADRKLSYNIAEEIVLAAQDAAGIIRSDPVRVIVRHGPPAGLDVAVPDKVTAGAGITVRITAVDAYRNTVETFDRSDHVTTVRVEAPNAPPATEVSPEAFVKGRAEVTVNYFMAGSARVSAELNGRKITSSPVEILPAALHHFDLDLPSQGRAGEPFRLTLRARDAFGNTPADYDRTGQGVQIHSSGVSEVQPAVVMPAAFTKGVAQVDVVTYAAESLLLTATERFGSASGRSGRINISAGPLDHFLVSASPRIQAGEKFPIRIEAQDMYYNLVRQLQTSGYIRLSASGNASVQPAQIDAGRFANGVALVQAAVSATGQTEITVATEDRKAVGKSNPVTVLPAEPASYRVDVLDPVTAGEPFRVRVNAVDAFGNPVENMKSLGRHVRIGSQKRGQIVTPDALSPQLFRGGSAEAWLVVPQAGRVTLQIKDSPGEAGGGWIPEKASRIEGLYFKTYGYTGDRTDIYLLASGPVEYRAAEPSRYGDGFDALVLTFPNASLQREIQYDALDFPGLRAAKLSAHATSDVPATPRLILKMDSRYAYSVNARANLLVVSLSPGPGTATSEFLPAVESTPAPASTIPSLLEIQAMVNRGDYKTARRAVELFLSAHPGHPDAMALRTRLEKVLRLLGQ